jgi:putative ABC transport system permease protein
MFKIFIVEDDKQLVTLLDEHLHKFGFDTQPVNQFDYDMAVAKINSQLHRAYGELNKIVTQQLVLLFFVPIIVAIIHSIFAFMALQSFFTMSIATEMIIVLACFFIAQVIYFLFIRHHYLRNLKKTLI